MGLEDFLENPIAIVFGLIGAIVGFVIAGVYTHALTTMATGTKWFYGIMATFLCAGAGMLIGNHFSE